MKLRLIIPVIALATMIFGCKKNNTTQTDLQTGFGLQALQNNATNWSGYPKANFETGTDSLFIQGSGMWDLLLMKFKFTGLGQYTLNSDKWNYYQMFGEVIIRGQYYLRTDVASTVSVTYYNTDTKIVEGTFDLHFIRTSGSDSSTPPNVDFTNGSFRVQLLQ